ncbi:DUF3667 domain-containing protein [uncultured Bacteroides sp.]|uniref:DUF3667 domain-containing protein n=1 Tax=uncultured Bacteroides sp. TaxID=162156 RepID=UPI002620277F|nr:DUF3667 domain-containing protein [uncultured Bacteroides sp.]
MLRDWKERLRARSRRVRRKIELMRLRRIRKKRTPKYTHCKNCGTTLEGMYCHRCGQYALDVEQPFWKYVRQYFENVYQFDTKIGRTLWYMFTRPGFLTAEFNAGKINSYVHPFRLYMCISVVFFAVFFMLVGERAGDFNALTDGRLRRSIVEQVKQSGNRDGEQADTTVYLYQVPGLVKTLKLRFGVEDADSLVRFQPVDDLYGLARTTLPRLLVDSCFKQTDILPQDWDYIRKVRALKNLNIENWIDGKDYGPDNAAAIRAFRVDSIRTGNDSLVLQPQKVYIWTDDVKKDAEADTLQKEQFTNDIIAGLSKWTPFYMMFLLPLFAAMLKLFYARKRMPYMWHFVHAIHLNTVFLILICIPLVPLFAYGIDDLVAAGQTLNTVQLNSLRITLTGFPVALFLYMLVSFRTVYRQGWVKTTVKAVLFYVLFSAIASLLAATLLIWLLAAEAEAI